jgi:hypothetical protein
VERAVGDANGTDFTEGLDPNGRDRAMPGRDDEVSQESASWGRPGKNPCGARKKTRDV